MEGGRKEGRWEKKREKREGGRKEGLSKAHILEISKLEDLRSLRFPPT